MSSELTTKKYVRTNGQDTIELQMTWEYAGIPSFGQGKSNSMSCALARPYKQLFEQGKPIGKINHVFFQVNNWPSRILGSLCLTFGQRILFYPGLTERKVNWWLSRKQGFRGTQNIGPIDHITLEKKLQKWHVTIIEPDGTKKRYLPSFRTRNVQKRATFWFGLTIQKPESLEVTPEKLTLAFPSPPKDSKRRIDLLINARKDALLHLITLNKISLKKDEFLHFDFLIGPKDLTLTPWPCFAPTQKPIIYGYAQTFKDGIHVQCHPVSLEGMTDRIWVVASKHIGKVSNRAIMVCP